MSKFFLQAHAVTPSATKPVDETKKPPRTGNVFIVENLTQWRRPQGWELKANEVLHPEGWVSIKVNTNSWRCLEVAHVATEMWQPETVFSNKVKSGNIRLATTNDWAPLGSKKIVKNYNEHEPGGSDDVSQTLL